MDISGALFVLAIIARFVENRDATRQNYPATTTPDGVNMVVVGRAQAKKTPKKTSFCKFSTEAPQDDKRAKIARRHLRDGDAVDILRTIARRAREKFKMKYRLLTPKNTGKKIVEMLTPENGADTMIATFAK